MPLNKKGKNEKRTITVKELTSILTFGFLTNIQKRNTAGSILKLNAIDINIPLRINLSFKNDKIATSVNDKIIKLTCPKLKFDQKYLNENRIESNKGILIDSHSMLKCESILSI